MTKFGITTDNPYHPLSTMLYSEIRGENVEISQIERYCTGCDCPLIEEDLNSGDCVFTNYGDVYCHSDCQK